MFFKKWLRKVPNTYTAIVRMTSNEREGWKERTDELLTQNCDAEYKTNQGTKGWRENKFFNL